LSSPLEIRHYERTTWDGWRPAHGVRLEIQPDGLRIAETQQHDWHLIRLEDEAFLYRCIRLRGTVVQIGTAPTWFYIHHFGSLDITEIDFQTGAFRAGERVGVNVQHSATKRSIDFCVEYLSCHSTISVRFSKNGSKVYQGTEDSAFLIRSLTLEVLDGSRTLAELPADQRLVLVDVGGQQGLQLKWMLRAREISPVLFEPIPLEARRLQNTVGRIPGAKIVQRGLSNRSRGEALHLTRSSGCSSILAPNEKLFAALQY
jgi:hypothetical protein